ncbi:MAG: hypothetical protein GY849_08145 [Deltaproteobacteria bacterium]|nr:hypothetical protein [Deltaproteobacteria bacterium]
MHDSTKDPYDDSIDNDELKAKVIEFLKDLSNDFPNGPESTYNRPAGRFIGETLRYGRELRAIIGEEECT